MGSGVAVALHGDEPGAVKRGALVRLARNVAEVAGSVIEQGVCGVEPGRGLAVDVALARNPDGWDAYTHQDGQGVWVHGCVPPARVH